MFSSFFSLELHVKARPFLRAGDVARAGYTHVTGDGVSVPSTADLKFLHQLRQTRVGNFVSKSGTRIAELLGSRLLKWKRLIRLANFIPALLGARPEILMPHGVLELMSFDPSTRLGSRIVA